MIGFWTVATIIWLVLLAVLLKPLLYRADKNRLQKSMLSKNRLAVGALVAVFTVATSALLYVYWSEGYSVLIASPNTDLDMAELTEQLADRLEQSPDNAEGWVLLAGSYATLGQYDKAVTAYAQAELYAELEAWTRIDYAEALLIAEGSLNTKANSLLEAAMAITPDDPQGLFLMGLANLERLDYPQTIFYWERLSALLEEDDALAAALEEKLTEVRALVAEMPQTDQSMQRQETDAEQSGRAPSVESGQEYEDCFMRINVALADELSSKISPTDTLFVYAKASQGPPMPLAIKQFKANELPLETCLGPEDSMIEGFTIDSFDSVQIIARISKSGLAAAQPGDMQAQSEAMPPKTGDAVSLVINEILE